MKKLILIAIMFVTGSALMAQQDTVFNKNRQTQPQPRQQQPTTPAVPQPQTTTPARENSAYRTTDRALVPQDQIPSALRQTLQGTQYTGWENSLIYQDKLTGEYSLEMKTETSTPKVYRFDKNGRMIQDPNKPGSQNNQDQ